MSRWQKYQMDDSENQPKKKENARTADECDR